jgi:hypothetical protein
MFSPNDDPLHAVVRLAAREGGAWTVITVSEAAASVRAVRMRGSGARRRE